MRLVTLVVFALSGFPFSAIAQDERNTEDSLVRIRELAARSLTQLHDDDLAGALGVLGEATDLVASVSTQDDVGLSPAAAALHRRLAQLDADERYNLLHAWSMPAGSRQTVRVFNTLVPHDPPPKAFARVLGERPRDSSFAVAKINGVTGVFSSAWLLVNSAEEAGRLRRLMAELNELAEEGVPGADMVLLLARTVNADRLDEELSRALKRHVAVLHRAQPPRLAGRGVVPRELMWQYGYTPVDPDPTKIDFKPLPHWTGQAWQGGAEYPNPKLGWIMMTANGGHTGLRLSPILRWVAPADGTLSIDGELKHVYEQGDGVRGRIVSSRAGMSGEWQVLGGAVKTPMESIEVKAWDTIDFVTDRVQNNQWDQYHWPVQLTLTTADAETLSFDSATVSPGPAETDLLAESVLVAACLKQEWLQPFSESIIQRLLRDASHGQSRLVRPFLQRLHAFAVASRNSGEPAATFGSASPKHFVVANSDYLHLHARGGSPGLWLTHDDHIVQVSGAASNTLLFRYPLTGDFEFSCQTQQGGDYPTDGGLVYGGLQFLGPGAQQELTILDADSLHPLTTACPFVRDGDFNRLSIMSTKANATFAVNGHSIWQDAGALTSPWIGLRAFGGHRPLFRNMKITGSPVIPREVRLVEDKTMRGWRSQYYYATQPSFAGMGPAEDIDWFVRDSTIHVTKREVAAAANPQGLLRYQRPLLDGESISCEFLYEPGKTEVHPALGRLAFLIEPNGVRLHWLTDGQLEWTGLTADNAIVEPLNRRGPAPLPLKSGEWNQLTVSLKNDRATLSLNNVLIYQRRMESQDGWRFGLFRHRGRAVQVRDVVITGDWPEHVPADVLAELTAPNDADLSLSELAALNDVFGESLLATNVLATRARATALSDQQRYEFLSRWVLPNPSRPTLRMAGAFTATHPAQAGGTLSGSSRGRVDGGIARVQIGGQLAAPAYDLVDTASRLNRLDDLLATLETFAPNDERQQRARCALLFLIEAASGDHEAAAAASEKLLTLREQNSTFRYESLWPETLVVSRGLRDPETRAAVSDLASNLFTAIQREQSSGLVAWDLHVAALYGLRRSLSREQAGVPGYSGSQKRLENWIPVILHTAQSRGQGHPQTRWERRGTRVDKIAAHGHDYLFYRIPLTGDFDVACEATSVALTKAGLMFGGKFYRIFSPSEFHQGNTRTSKRVPLDKPLTKVERWSRLRIKVRGRTLSMYYNGKQIANHELTEHYDPWLAIYSKNRDQSAVRDLRIAGTPVVPDAINMAADEELSGWWAYFGETIGPAASGGRWRHRDFPFGSGIHGVRLPALAGSSHESLLRYHRPLVEDSVVEYEFFYVPGQTHTHCALDRLAFLIGPEGVVEHWVTDGRFERFGNDPANRTVIAKHRRGDGKLPLRAGDWNKMNLAVRGDIVELALNGQRIYERPIEASNQRTFALFHFADQTEVRVRNLVLRGDWPKSVPAIADQELASELPAGLARPLARASEFSHDFAADGLPKKYFTTLQSPFGSFIEQENGLFANVKAPRNWSAMTFSPRFQLHGDFDVEVAFDQLRIQGDDEAGVILNAELADDARRHNRVLRMKNPTQQQLLHASWSLLRPDGTRTYDQPETIACEALSGRLRLSRRGNTIYQLFAENDSPVFRLVGSQPASDVATTTAADGRDGGIMVRTISKGDAYVSAVWKNIKIRAEKLTWHPPADERPVPTLVVMNTDGSGVREITGPPKGFTQLGSPEWSPDGKTIAFDASLGSTTNSHVYLVNADGTELRDAGLGCMPSFSRDGKRLVQSLPGQGIMLMNATGSQRESIARNGWGAQWSPDGKFIAWGQSGNIIVMDVKTNKQKPLLVGEQANLFDYTYWNLGWSHDSRSIAFKARNRRTRGEDIVVADIDDPNGFKILRSSSRGIYVDFTFLANNRRVLFAMADPADNIPRLFYLDRDQDGPPQRLPVPALNWRIVGAAVSPDGSRIAFPGEQIPQPVAWPRHGSQGGPE
jgi:hypothetical protein